MTALKFGPPEDLEPCDALFACLPHGKLAGMIDELAASALKIIDLSADFRLRDAGEYELW
jgi:N-acetyl-gamma-glutamyl-phosphate/LysW-gamma-L-alpha-aminoadipyl-6-phosphate reductase